MALKPPYIKDFYPGSYSYFHGKTEQDKLLPVLTLSVDKKKTWNIWFILSFPCKNTHPRDGFSGGENKTKNNFFLNVLFQQVKI